MENVYDTIRPLIKTDCGNEKEFKKENGLKTLAAGVLATTLTACASVGDGISKVGQTVSDMGKPTTTTQQKPTPAIADQAKKVYCDEKSVAGGAIDGAIAVGGASVLGKVFGTDSTLGKVLGGAATGAGNRAVKNTVCVERPEEPSVK